MPKFIRRSGNPMWMGKQEFIRHEMPYGIWTCADGREVLFDRDYKPICERFDGGPARKADPREFIEWKKQDYYYDDGVPEVVRRGVAEKVLREWGYFDECMREINALIARSNGE